jgi:hypothetical protein
MTSDASRGKNNDEFRRLMLAGALSLSPELAAACDKLETATIEELDAALAGDAQRSFQLNAQRSFQLHNEAAPQSATGAPERTPLVTIAMPAAALAAPTADVSALAHEPETFIDAPESNAEGGIPVSRSDNEGTPTRTSAPMLARNGVAVSELRRVAVSAGSPSPEASPTRFARAMSLIRSQFATATLG